MGDRVGDQCLLVETEEKDGDLHCSSGLSTEPMRGFMCYRVRKKIKTMPIFYAFERHCSLHTVQM